LREEVQDLVREAQAGDETAFNRLAADHRGRLEALVWYRLKGQVQREVEVDDVIQESLLRALRAIERFEWRGEDSFWHWLGGIAVNVIREAREHARRSPRVPLPCDPPAESLTQSRSLRRDERFDRLQEAFDELSPDYQRVIHLARIQRLPIKNVAKIMKRSPDAVTHLLMRAVQKLRDAIGETESYHLPYRALEYSGEPDGEGEDSHG